jgi:hypothetical protein
VINNKIDFCDISNFPYLLEGFQASKLEYFIKLFLLCEKLGCYVYDYGVEGYRYFIKDIKKINKVLLHNYLYNIIDDTKYKPEIAVTCYHLLNNLPTKDNYNYLLYQYIKNYFPQELSTQVNPDQEINKVIESKYHLLKRYNNLRDFQKYYEIVTTKAKNYIRENEHSPTFLKYAARERKNNVKRLHFDPYISLMNPLYTIGVQDNVGKFVKEIGLKPKNPYRSKYRY